MQPHTPEAIASCPVHVVAVTRLLRTGRHDHRQYYPCERCAYHVAINQLQHGMAQQYVQLCSRLYLEDMGFRAIERVVGVSHEALSTRSNSTAKRSPRPLNQAINYQLLRFVAT